MKARRDKYKLQDKDKDSSDNEEKLEIDKEEIENDLGLAQFNQGGSNKTQAGSKEAIMKDLLDTMNKEIEKLKRNEGNINLRMKRIYDKEYDNPTEEELKHHQETIEIKVNDARADYLARSLDRRQVL